MGIFNEHYQICQVCNGSITEYGCLCVDTEETNLKKLKELSDKETENE